MSWSWGTLRLRHDDVSPQGPRSARPRPRKRRLRISALISSSFDAVLLARKMLKPAPASCSAKSRPMPAVAPVTTVQNRVSDGVLPTCVTTERTSPGSVLRPKLLELRAGSVSARSRATGSTWTNGDSGPGEVKQHPRERGEVAREVGGTDKGEGDCGPCRAVVWLGRGLGFACRVDATLDSL